MEKIQSDRLPLKESINARNDIERQLKEITKPYDRMDITAMIHWRDLIDIIPDKLKDLKMETLGIRGVLELLISIPIELIDSRLRVKNIVHLSKSKQTFCRFLVTMNLLKRFLGRLLKNRLGRGDMRLAGAEVRPTVDFSPPPQPSPSQGEEGVIRKMVGRAS